MAKFEDYLPGGSNDPNKPVGGIDAEIAEAAQDQQARQNDATPTDWEERYRNLERLNSQQAQQLGDYRKIVDDYITNPTPASEPASQPEPYEFTDDDWFENRQEVLRKAVQSAVESHPAIAEANEIKAKYDADARDRQNLLEVRVALRAGVVADAEIEVADSC